MAGPAPSLTGIVNSGVVPPGLHDFIVGNSFKYASAGDHVIELINILITLKQHNAELETRLAACEAALNITPDPGNVF